ncbi:TonB-dependent receptor [Alteromonadaceae bacterium BrNp21-10]|nr:TonB-dependent receptor [Alteromonadaceae bacterium BrNp21-10]
MLWLSYFLAANISSVSQAELKVVTPADIEKISISGRRQQNIDSQAVSAINADTINLQQSVHINELLSRAAGTWVSRGNGQESLTAIRSPVLTGAGACGAFLVAEDSISIRPAGFCNANQLFEVNSEQADSVEVTRGPGSHLFGSNAVHGVINVLTPDVFSQSPLSLGIEGGANGYQRARFSIAQQHSDQSQDQQQGWMLYGNLMKTQGYQADSDGEQHKLNGIHQYQHSDLSVKSVIAATHLNQHSAGFIQGDDGYLDDKLRRSNTNPDGFRHANAIRAYSRWLWQWDDQRSFQLTPFIRSSQMTFSQHWVPWSPTETNRQHSAGVHLQYQQQFSQWQLLAGLDSEWSDSALSETQTRDFSPTLPQGQHYQYKVSGQSLSPWIDAQWQWTTKTQLSAGLRFDHMAYDYQNLLSDGQACAADVTACRFYRPSDRNVSYSDWSPRLALSHQWSPQQAIYLQASRGFRAPQTTELFRLQAGQQIADLQSEQLTNFELGLRGNIALSQSDVSTHYDINLFSMHKRNMIFQDTERQNISNGASRHRGIEATLRSEFNPQFYTEFSGTYAEHTYANNIHISQLNINGNVIDTAPKTMGQVTLGWQSAENTGVSNQPHRIELQWQHLAEYYLNPENTASYPGHNLLHLNTTWWLNDQLKLSFNIRNLTNKKYAERADYAFGNYRYFVGLPRSLYLGLQWQL